MSEAASLMIQPVGPVKVAARLWRYRGQVHVTAIAKATFGMVHGGPMRVLDPVDLYATDMHTPDAPALAAAPCDLVPLLPRADVTFVGSAYAARAGAQRTRVRLALSRPRELKSKGSDGPLLLDKVLEIVGSRTLTGAWGEPQPALFTKVPITYDRALGGPNHPLNPVGVGMEPDARGRTHLPNIVHPAHSAMPVDPAGFGPIPMSWPARARLLPDLETRLAMPVMMMPDDVDLAHFHAAPFDQRIEFLRGDEWIILDKLHPRHERFETQLPFVAGVARVHTRAGEEHQLHLRADALHIDGDAETATLVFRGSFPVPSEDALRMLAITAGMEQRGVPTVWPSVDWPKTLVVEIGAASPLKDTAIPSTQPSAVDEPPRTVVLAGKKPPTLVVESTVSDANGPAESPAPATMVLSSTRVRGGTLVIEPGAAPGTQRSISRDIADAIEVEIDEEIGTLEEETFDDKSAPMTPMEGPATIDVDGPTQIAAFGDRALLLAAAKLASTRRARDSEHREHIAGVAPLSAWQTPDEEEEDDDAATHLMSGRPSDPGPVASIASRETPMPESAERPTSTNPNTPAPRSPAPRTKGEKKG